MKEGIEFPVPFDRPMFKLVGEIVQAKVVPGKLDVKGTANVEVFAHNVWSAGSIKVGVGLTVIVNVCGDPTQPDPTAVGVIVYTTTWSIVVWLIITSVIVDVVWSVVVSPIVWGLSLAIQV